MLRVVTGDADAWDGGGGWGDHEPGGEQEGGGAGSAVLYGDGPAQEEFAPESEFAAAGVATAEAPQKKKRKPKPDTTVTRPQTIWVAFCQQKRQEINETRPGLSFAELAKVFKEEYRKLTAEERARLTEICEKDKERWKNELLAKGIDPATLMAKPRVRSEKTKQPKKEGETGGGENTGESGVDELVQIPLTRIKKLMKLDPDVKQLAGDAILAVSRCTELFLSSLVNKCHETSERRGMKTIHLADVIHTVQTRDCFEFLRLDLRKSMGDTDLNGAGVGNRKRVGGDGFDTLDTTGEYKRRRGAGTSVKRASAGGGARSKASSSSSNTNPPDPSSLESAELL